MTHDPFGGHIKDKLFEDLLVALLREHELRRKVFEAGARKQEVLGAKFAKESVDAHVEAQRLMDALAARTPNGRPFLR